MPDPFGTRAHKVTIKGGRTSASQRDILGRAIAYADKAKAPYAAKIAMIEALIQESEAKNLRAASGDGYGSYGVLQGRDKYHSRKNLLNPEYQFGVFLGTSKKWPNGFTSKGSAIKFAKQGMSPGKIAQAVEGSAYPDRYATSAGEAKRIIRLYRSANGQGGRPAAATGGTSAPAAAVAALPTSTAEDTARRQKVIIDMMTAENPNNPLINTISSAPTFQPPAVAKVPTAAKPGAKPKAQTVPSSAGADGMVAWAKSQLGTKEGSRKQKWYANKMGVPASVPWCSVFVGVGLKHFGASLPANPAYSGSWIGWKGGKKVGRSQIRPGDLIIYDWGDGGITDHVALYVGNGKRIGGNQSNAVTTANADLGQSVAIIRPSYNGRSKK